MIMKIIMYFMRKYRVRAMMFQVKDTYYFVDYYQRVWKLTPTGHPDFPFRTEIVSD